MTAFGIWWCEAYGPPEDGVPAETWPRCFLSAEVGERRCETASVCADVMDGERHRVFRRIQEMAAAGDDVAVMLAEGLTSPDDLLGGKGAAPG